MFIAHAPADDVWVHGFSVPRARSTRKVCYHTCRNAAPAIAGASMATCPGRRSRTLPGGPTPHGPAAHARSQELDVIDDRRTILDADPHPNAGNRRLRQRFGEGVQESSRAPDQHADNSTTPGGAWRIMQASHSADTGPSAAISRPGAPRPDPTMPGAADSDHLRAPTFVITSCVRRHKAAHPVRNTVPPLSSA
jgi:hypothetical protein